MKYKKILLSFVFVFLAFSMMACPSKTNQAPQIVRIIDGEPVKIDDNNQIIYEHEKGKTFHPETMVQDLIDNYNIKAIDYNQSKIALGNDRPYDDISDALLVTNFYLRWEEDSDANFDGVVDDLDEELWGTIKTDEEGNYVLDAGTVFVVSLQNVGGEMPFTLRIVDEDGARSEVSGKIKIV